MTKAIMKVTILILTMITLLSSVIALGDMGAMTDEDGNDGRENEFLKDNATKISMLLPAIMLVTCIIMFAIDFGAVGVSMASMGSIVVLSLLGMIYISWVSIITFVVLTSIIVYKLQQ